MHNLIQEMKENKQLRIFTFFSMFFFTVFFSLAITCTTADDYFWHVKIGEWIVDNKQIPTTGVLSWHGENLPWMAHEWLADIFLYLLYYVLGNNIAIYLYIIIVFTILSYLIYKKNKDMFKKNILFSLTYIIFMFFVFNASIVPRPFLFVYILLFFLIQMCEKIKNNQDKHIYIKMFLFTLFFANWHGGLACLTYVIPIIYLFSNLFDFKIGKIVSIKNNNFYKYIKIIILNIFTMIINPYGYKLLLYPFSYNEEQTNYIIEWKSLSLREFPILMFFIIFLIIVFIQIKDNIDFSDFSIIGSFIFLSFMSVRFILFLCVISTAILYKYIPAYDIKDKKLLQTTIYLINFTTIFLLTFNIFAYSLKLNNPNSFKEIPDNAIEIIKENNPQRLYNDYNLSSYLLFNNIETFVDGRADCFQGHGLLQSVASGYEYISSYSPGEFIKEYQFDMFITYDDTIINNFLKTNNEYKQIYYDKDTKIIIYKKYKYFSY